MSIQSLNSGNPYSAALASSSTQATQSAQGTRRQQAVQGQDGTQDGKQNSGTYLSELKASLEAQGFSRDNTTMSKADYEKAMHDFVHAAFSAVHAQKQADRAGNQSADTDMAQGFSEVASQCANGNAPADLQAAFQALQATQGSGNGANTTLAQVLQGMSQTQNNSNTNAGWLVDMQA